MQKGLDGPPKVIAEGVDRVLWGPISHRAVVQDVTGRSKLYDGRDGTWKDLGFILESAWSPDEERLLFVDAGNATEPGYLSLLSGTSIERLCPMSRIGQVGKIVFSADQTKAYLLATLAGPTRCLDDSGSALEPPKISGRGPPFCAGRSRYRRMILSESMPRSAFRVSTTMLASRTTAW